MPKKALLAAGCLAIVALGIALAHPGRVRAADNAQDGVGPNCDRACLYGFLDQYLDALKMKDPSRLPLAKNFRYSENNVIMDIGDGVWGTVTGLGNYNLRMADTTNGEVGPFPSKPNLVDKPVLNEIVPPELRRPRARMIALVDGYFSTLQLNDGVLFTQFDDNCNRIENGLQTTHNPDLMKIIPVANLGCAQQFKLGNYRYDDRVRDRRFFLVDEERGLVMAAGFIDHAGRLANFALTDGTVIHSSVRTPSTLCLLELFKIRDGKIQQIEAVFIGVPYNMHSPWIHYH
jgi:hypothetical protein